MLDKPTYPDQEKSCLHCSEGTLRRTMDLIFYAHMELADRADQVLADYKLGRPHHRVLYFVVQRPGITVNELLSTLRITNQAFSRTINQLVQMNLVEQRMGN